MQRAGLDCASANASQSLTLGEIRRVSGTYCSKQCMASPMNREKMHVGAMSPRTTLAA